MDILKSFGKTLIPGYILTLSAHHVRYQQSTKSIDQSVDPADSNME